MQAPKQSPPLASADQVSTPGRQPVEILFRSGLVGCPEWRLFAFILPEEAPGLALLQSLDDADVAFVLAPVEDLVPEFLATLGTDDHELLQALGVGRDPTVRLYCTLSVQTDDSVTANLLGPLVLDFGRRCGTQVVLTGSPWSTRHPIVSMGK
jgi:flagellar assembly factor FliW